MSEKGRLGSRLIGKTKGKDRDESVGSPSNNLNSRSFESEGQSLEARAPSWKQRTREAAILLLDFGIIASEANDVLKPIKAACGCAKKVLEIAKVIEQVDDDWKELVRRLELHITSIESQTNSLEEDESAGEMPPAVNPEISEPLQDYIGVLNTVYEQLNTMYGKSHGKGMNLRSRMKKVVDIDYNRGVIVQKTRDLEDAFQRYTVALVHLVAKKVDRIQQELSQLRVEFKHEVKVAHLDRLKDSTVYGNQHLQCLNGTRVETLRTIRRWANDETTTNRIFGLLDVAGSGKSTVAKHMVEEWKNEGWLIGRFFFSRDTTETMSTRLFCSTVSDAFASINEDFNTHVSQFKQRPDWKHLSFEEQFEGLVAGPLRKLNKRAILTIDALDECSDLMRVLETLRHKQSSVPLLRTFVTGRPEADIKEWAKTVKGIHVANFRSLEGYNRDVDIFIRFRLKHIPRIHNRVIRRADGLFIWARIACDLLAEAADIEGLLIQLEGRSEGDAKLDAIYRIALEQATPKDQPSKRAMIIVLQMILAAREPLSIAELENLSPWNGKNVVERIVTRLGSLLLYKDREDPIRLLHATIREFLIVQRRSGDYYVQLELGHYSLALESMDFLRSLSSSENEIMDSPSKRKEISRQRMIYLLWIQNFRIRVKLMDAPLCRVVQEAGSQSKNSRFCEQWT